MVRFAEVGNVDVLFRDDNGLAVSKVDSVRLRFKEADSALTGVGIGVVLDMFGSIGRSGLIC